MDSNVIYVARRGWHIDIGFSAADLQGPIRSIESDFPGLKTLFFGFGDQRYLLAKHRNSPVLLAALWPGKAMLLATGLSAPPREAFGAEQVIALRVTYAQLLMAETYVWRSLDGTEASLGAYEGSLYYPAAVQYSAFHTCNTWAAEVLQAAGLGVHSRGVIFAGQLWSQVKRQTQSQVRAGASSAD
ncbi:MAG: DUF2459 domain-containing protein [Pseudomonadota bacterium]|nr:DUF2459 domain-containing protein [Pseudomonadota bacterium]